MQINRITNSHIIYFDSLSCGGSPWSRPKQNASEKVSEESRTAVIKFRFKIVTMNIWIKSR